MINLLNEFENVSIILDVEKCDELVGQLYDEDIYFEEETEESVEEMLNEEPFFIVSKNAYWDEVEYVIEPLLKANAEQYYLENDVILIDDDLLDIIEFDKLEGKIFSFTVEEELEEDYCDYEYCEDEEECDCYKFGFEDGYLKAIQDMRNFLDIASE